jgi:hypothetical protein
MPLGEIKMNDDEPLSSIELKFTGHAENSFENILKRQMELHEGVTFIDLLKFLYQSSLGPFHIFEMMDENRMMNWIKRNLENANFSNGPLIEELYGKKWVRLNLAAYKKKCGSDYRNLFEAFIRSKSMKKGQLKEFEELQEKLVAAVRKGRIDPLTCEPRILLLLEDFLKRYKEKGYPPIHHSEVYTQKNDAEYLVIPRSSLNELV